MNNYKKHQELLNHVKLALQKRFPNARVFDRHVGVFRFLRSNGIIKINKPGMADLWMLCGGRHIELEIKTGKAKQTNHQKNWEKIIKQLDCEYYVIRSIEDVELIPL